MQILQAEQGAGSNGGQSSQGGSSQTAQGEASGGAGHGENDNGDGIGPEAGNEPISQDNAPGDGGESSYQALMARMPLTKIHGTWFRRFCDQHVGQHVQPVLADVGAVVQHADLQRAQVAAPGGATPR